MKRNLQQGNYRVLAHINIGEGESQMLLSTFNQKVSKAAKLLKPAAENYPEAELALTGMEEAVLERVAIVGDETSQKEVLDGLGQIKLLLSVDQKQVEKADEITSHAKKYIGEGIRIAEQMEGAEFDANKLNELLKGNPDELAVRAVIASSTQSRNGVIFSDGSVSSHGGNKQIPSRISKGDSIELLNCKIKSFSTSRSTLAVQQNESDNLHQIHCMNKPQIFSLLKTANAWGCSCDLVLQSYENVKTKSSRVEIVEFTNKKSVSMALIDYLKKVGDED